MSILSYEQILIVAIQQKISVTVLLIVFHNNF